MKQQFKRNTQNISLALIAIAGLLWGLVQVKQNFYELTGLAITPGIEKFLLILGGVLAITGLFGLALAAGSSAWRNISSLISSFFHEKSIVFYNSKARAATRHEIAKAHDMCVEAFGDDIANQNLMSKWHKVNDQIFFFIESIDYQNENKTVSKIGYFDLIPLNESGVQAITDDEANGTCLLDTHVSTPDEKPSAVYIGGVFGGEFRARGACLLHVRTKLAAYESQGVTQFFTRPTSESGLRLVKRNNFSPVLRNKLGLNSLYVLNTSPRDV